MADDYGEQTPAMAVVGWLPVLLSVALFALFIPMLGPVGSGEALRYSWEWVPSLGINLSFWIDGLSLMFALLITGIGALIHLYSARYLRGHPQFARFALYLTAFELAMLGLVLADSLITLFVFWELTTITSYLLIGFNHYDPTSRRNATQALFVTGAGGMALLAGLIILGAQAGTFELSEIRAEMGNLADHVLYTPIAILFLLAAFTKSAQVPFHFWLPNAMAAPTPVSAYLHSATMVKAGVYLLARMHPNLSGTDLWVWSLTILGGITAVFASIMAVKQTDMKQTLAYTTLMALGTLTLYLASDVPLRNHRRDDVPVCPFSLQGRALSDCRDRRSSHRNARSGCVGAASAAPCRSRPLRPLSQPRRWLDSHRLSALSARKSYMLVATALRTSDCGPWQQGLPQTL